MPFDQLVPLTNRVHSIQKAYHLRFSKKITLLNKEERKRLRELAHFFSEYKIEHFSSASGNQEITVQARELILGLFNGKNELEHTKQELATLRQQDKQGIKGSYSYPITSGILALGGTLACILMLVLIPVTLPYVIVIAYVSIFLFVLTGYLFKMNIDFQQKILQSAWDDNFGGEVYGITGLLNDQLTEDDIQLLRKINSPQWNDQVKTAESKLIENSDVSYYPSLFPDQEDSLNKATTPGSSFTCKHVIITEEDKRNARVYQPRQ